LRSGCTPLLGGGSIESESGTVTALRSSIVALRFWVEDQLKVVRVQREYGNAVGCTPLLGGGSIERRFANTGLLPAT